MVNICSKTLFDIIQEHVFLKPANHSGWHGVKCLVCNDHSFRAAFHVCPESTSYNCFNCKAGFFYEEGSGKLSKNARSILRSFGITRNQLSSLQSPLLIQREKDIVDLSSLREIKLDTPTILLPDKSFPIGHPDHEELQIPLAQYLINRKIDPLEINAHFSLDPRLLGRVIIPFYRNGKVIYWQARSIDPSQKRYLNSVNPRDAVLYGYDVLYNYDSAPLFVTEGVFDAICVKGVCILGSTLNDAKIEIFKKCKRRVIFVIDRDKSGNDLGKQVIENGWELSFVDKRASDINDSVIQFGLPYTVYTLMNNATKKLPGHAAKTILGLGVLEARLGKFK